MFHFGTGVNCHYCICNDLAEEIQSYAEQKWGQCIILVYATFDDDVQLYLNWPVDLSSIPTEFLMKAQCLVDVV